MQDKKLKMLTGVVIGKSGNKNAKVAIDYRVKHAKYNKYLKRRTRLAIHDEHNQAGLGDLVEIAECRPLSKTKSWRLIRVVQKAESV
ncbi:MAG: 30S ribosomal protein S17 [Sedimentisphaerales bacterium]|jgi:small subunit ribosomal protein S17|nr:30S ribosomal protein S17 [Sedimentisphaerales bacterium]